MSSVLCGMYLCYVDIIKRIQKDSGQDRIPFLLMSGFIVNSVPSQHLVHLTFNSIKSCCFFYRKNNKESFKEYFLHMKKMRKQTKKPNRTMLR